jgi:hypothetical protein
VGNEVHACSKGRFIMALAAEKEMEHIGESRGCMDHDHDLIHELSKRLDALWRYDQYIANADSKPALQALWRDLKRQEAANILRLKQLVAEEIKQNCF